MQERIDVGDLARIRGDFRVGGITLGDPNVVSLALLKPDQSKLSYTSGLDVTLVKETKGRYYRDTIVDQSGTWAVRWVGDGGEAQGAVEFTFYVMDSKFDLS